MTTTFENFAPLTPALTELEGKKYDQILITGEVFRAKTRKKQLGSTDNSYDISVKLDAETFKELKKFRGAEGEALTGLKKVELKKKVLDDEGKPVKENDAFVYELDDMDEPVKEFSHYQISLRQRAQINGQDIKPIPVTMIDTGANVDDWLSEGTKVTVEGQVYITTFRDKPALGLNLKEIKVHELVAFEGAGGNTDIWASVGLAAAVVPDFNEDSTEEEGTSQEPQAPASAPAAPPVPNGVVDGDFDDDIPF